MLSDDKTIIGLLPLEVALGYDPRKRMLCKISELEIYDDIGMYTTCIPFSVRRISSGHQREYMLYVQQIALGDAP